MSSDKVRDPQGSTTKVGDHGGTSSRPGEDSLRLRQAKALSAPAGNVAATDGVEETLVQDAAQIEHALEISGRTEQPPANVAGYTISLCLGQGAYGSVWLARENNTGKQVAVKFYTHRRGLDWSLLNREVEKLAVLYTSRHIVRLIDVGWDSDPPYYVMEYLDNGSLASFLANGPLPPNEVVRIAKSVLQALVHAHGSGILHCDLKPANVLLDAEFEARLCDFGQSRLSDEQKPALGTLFYMAPEQADMKAVPDARWDVYAVGTLLYHMLCGEPPFRTPENEALIRSTESLEDRLAVYRRIVRQSPRPTQHRKARGVDKRLAEIVDRCLQVNPDKRFPNAQAVLDALHLRDRQRSRRPIIALGVVGPAVLFLAMAPIIYQALQNAERKARESLIERALDSGAQAAGILSRSIDHELGDRQSELENIAADGTLRSALLQQETAGWDDRKDLVALLDRFKSDSDATSDKLGHQRDTSWLLIDVDGFQRWRQPPSDNMLDDNFKYRDYFHGLGAKGVEYNKATVPDAVDPLRDPYITLPFRSNETKRYMIAISVPIFEPENPPQLLAIFPGPEGIVVPIYMPPPPAPRRVIGILARTAHLGQLLTEYGEHIRSENRLIALADARSSQLLDHPWMTPEHLDALLGVSAASPSDGVHAHSESGAAALGKLQLFNSTKTILSGASQRDADGNIRNGTVRDPSYRDPISRLDPDKYGGEWLAALARVGNTGWTVIVQERKAASLRPVSELRSETLRYGLAALAVSAALIAVLWYFVLRAVNDRVLRTGQWRSEGHRTESSTTGLSTVSSQR